MPEPMFSKGESVLYAITNELGQIKEPPFREAQEYWYRVRFASRTESIAEEDLKQLKDEEDTLQSLASNGNWGQLDAVRCALAIERIQHTNRSTIYAFQNQRILFQPYQYKPLLKVLDSPDRRLLIADEVGMGKTIEAGLVLTELNARKPLDSVMVVCPSRLREKWRNEMNRKFDEDFEIFDRRGFEQTVQRFHERPGRVRVRGIMSTQAMRSKLARETLTSKLGALDLVIFDEAHHARNPNTSTSALLRDLCEVADSVILLTATPVQLDNSNLFTLLSALRPTEFRDAWAFEQSLQQHSDLHIASSLARTQKQENIEQIIAILRKVFITGRQTESIDPLARQLTEELFDKPPISRNDWVGIERRIQDLHPLGTILTRTKKRDVLENAPRRDASTYYCDWTTEESEAYQRLVESCRSNGWLSAGLSLAQITKARQAASCLPAAFDQQITKKTDDDSTELTDILPSEFGNDSGVKTSPAKSLERWKGADSKYDKFKEILDTIWLSEPGTKILVFAFFKGTVRYLENRVAESGIKVLRIDGDVLSVPREPEKDERGMRIRQFQEDPDVKVMVSTEVGSEGLDFQFCHHIVNYDLPWNPMVVEQRIGRIDRFGQKSDAVYIHNLVVRGTVEDRILERLYNRIGIFERSIGALEAILGDTVQSLKRDYLNGSMTDAEADRRVEQAANAIVQRNKSLEELEKNASQLFGHEEYVNEEVRRVKNLGQFVGECSILAILRTYLRVYHPEIKIKTDKNEVFSIRVTDKLRMDIQDAARTQNTVWHNASREGILTFTTSGEAAFEHSQLELVNSGHPLVQAAVEKLSERMKEPTARLGAAIVGLLDTVDKQDIPEGDYFLMLAPQQVYGIRNRRIIETVAIRIGSSDLLSGNVAQRLLHLVTEIGNDWRSGERPLLPKSDWDKMQGELDRRTTDLRTKEKGENEALYVRRRNALYAEHEHDLKLKNRRLETNLQKKNTKMLPAFRGQIDKAESRFRAKLNELDDRQSVSITSGEPIAVCVIRVYHNSEEGS